MDREERMEGGTGSPKVDDSAAAAAGADLPVRVDDGPDLEAGAGKKNGESGR
jgi:hypothetical protein